MYMLQAKNEKNEIVTLDDKIEDDFARTHDAQYCGQFYPDYHDFILLRIENYPDLGTNTPSEVA